MSKATTLSLVCAGLFAVMLPRANADEWNQKTIFTFSQPVEVPGRVLEPGTYVFKLMDSPSDRNVVQVFNKRENHCFGTFLSIPDYRLNAPDRPVITFEERAAGSPPAVRTWFYPGRNYGHEFVYHKVKEMAMVNQQQTTASMSQESSTTTTTTTQPAQTAETTEQAETTQQQTVEQAPPAQTANREESEITQESTPPAEAPASEPPKTLPHTGSSLPLIALLGLVSLAGVGLLNRAATTSHAKK